MEPPVALEFSTNYDLMKVVKVVKMKLKFRLLDIHVMQKQTNLPKIGAYELRPPPGSSPGINTSGHGQ